MTQCHIALTGTTAAKLAIKPMNTQTKLTSCTAVSLMDIRPKAPSLNILEDTRRKGICISPEWEMNELLPATLSYKGTSKPIF